jgi:hypothetical protein
MLISMIFTIKYSDFPIPPRDRDKPLAVHPYQ